MQSLVGDINSALVVHRNNFIAGRMAQDKVRAKLSLMCMNALLGDNYKLVFDTEKAKEQPAVVKYLICDDPSCAYENDLSKIRLYKKSPTKNYTYYIKYSKISNMLYGNCLQCKKSILCVDKNCIYEYKDNLSGVLYVRESPNISTVLDEAFIGYDFWKWVDEVVVLIERQHRRYREEIGTREKNEVVEA